MPDFYFRDPATFPARFSETLLDSVEFDRPILVQACRTEAEANRVMKEFRWWRWCIRESGTTSSKVYEIEQAYQVRTSKELSNGQWLVYVKASMNRLSVILSNNPNFAAEIAPYVN